jgi:tetratricopeptide (TPR) repeat protein
MPAFLASGPGPPTVALVPIEASSENYALASDIADELATALTRAGVAVAGKAESARYHLTGIMRGLGPQTRLTTRLVDAETGRHLWAYRSDDALMDGATREDQLAARIAAALQPCLRLAEIDRARRKPDCDLTPQDLALRAMPGVLALDAEGNAHALDLLELATDRDPDNALATALAAWARAQRIVYHFSATPVEERTRCADLARRARNLADNATVLAILGNALTSLHDLDTAGIVIRKALSVDAGSTWAWSRSGWIDVYRGNSESAIERLNIALDLAPNDPLAFNSFVGIGCAHFNAGRYSDAARWQERALSERPSATWIHRTLCPAYVLGGNVTAARRSLATLREHYPHLTVALVQQGLPPLPHAFRTHVVEALHTVGLPN